jgi:hypothetical protein
MTNYFNNILGALQYHGQFPENFLGVTWANGKSTFYTPTKNNPTTFFLVFSLPRGRNRRKSYASIASDPTYARVGAGGRADWVLPWFPSLLTCGRGRGSRDNPYTWHITYTSYAQCPRKSATKSNPNLRQIVGSSLDNPSFLFLPTTVLSY